MPEQIYLDAMDGLDLRSAYAAHDAAEALVALGWPVRAAEDESETWRIGYVVLTDEELIGLAARRGIRPAVERLQQAVAKGPQDPRAPLDPVEALIHIRAIIEASADGAYGTKAEPMVREIRSILDKALPPRRRRSPTKQ